MNARQRRLLNGSFGAIVKTDEGHILGDVSARFFKSLHRSKCGLVVAGQDSRKSHAAAQDTLHSLVTALGCMQTKIDKARITGQAVGANRILISVEPIDTVTFWGKVIDKKVEDGKNMVTLEVGAMIQDGTVVLSKGEAVVEL